MVLSWIRKLVARSNRYPARKPAGNRRRASLGVEALENRCLMSGVPASLTIAALGNLTVPLGSATTTVDASGNLVTNVQIKGGSFTKAGVQFSITDVDVQYTAATQEFDLSGTASASLLGQNVTATFGTASQPGIVVAGSTLQSLTGTITIPGSVKVGGAALTLSSASLGYNAGNNELDLGGTASLTTAGGPTFTLALGNATSDTSGVVIQNGKVADVDATVNGSFTVAGLSIQAQDLHVAYSAASASSAQTFTITGGADFTFEGSEFNIALTSPGLEIQNGQLQSLTASVNTNLNLFNKSIELNLNNVSVAYVRAGSRLTFWGTVGFQSQDLPGGGFQATLGTQASPGLVIAKGQLQTLDVTLNGGVLQVGQTLIEAQNLEVDYTGAQVQISGGVEVDLGHDFKGSGSIGSAHPITINTKTGAVQFNGVEVAMTVQAGSLGISADVTYTETTANNKNTFSLAASGSVQFPSGFSISGGFMFSNGQLTEVNLAYDAGTSAGIEVADTGLFITHVGGQLTDFNNPAALTAQITVGVTYGESITILGNKYDLFDALGTLTISKSQLDLTGTVDIAGGTKGGFGATTTATIDLDWADGIYSVTVTDLPIYMGLEVPIFEVSGNVTVTVPPGKPFNATLAITASAAVDLPPAVLALVPSALQPLVNGTSPNATFSLHYAPSATNDTMTATASLAGVGSVTVTEDFNGNINLNILNGDLKDVYTFVKGGLETLHQEFQNGLQTLEETWDAAGDHAKETWAQAVVLGTTLVTDTRDVWSAGKHSETVFLNGVETEEKDFAANGNYLLTTFSNGKAKVVGAFNSAGVFLLGGVNGATSLFSSLLSHAKSGGNSLKNDAENLWSEISSW